MDHQNPGSLRCGWFVSPTCNPDFSDDARLGAVDFAPAPQSGSATGFAGPRLTIPMACQDHLGRPASLRELWGGGGQLTFGQRGFLQYGQNEQVLFGAMTLNESDFAHALNGRFSLQAAAEAAYRALFELQDAAGFPHLLRTWNYFADINGVTHGLERYRQFNIGRQDACLASVRPISGKLPAASALGFAAGPLTIYFLAGRGRAPIALENPRQISAWNYPVGYGPRSPSFSRACVVWPGGAPMLFISGTASIVGHASMHVGDVLAQTRETLVNLAELVRQANHVAPEGGFSLEGLCCKVYLRDARDMPAVRGELLRRLGSAAQLVFLQADICRAELAVEIEAIGGDPADFAVHD